MIKNYPHLVIFVISLFIVLATLSVPQTVYTKEDMSALKLGYPIHFVTQDVSHFDPPLPWKYSFSSPWENPAKVQWVNFLLSIILTFSAIEILRLISQKYFNKK